MEIVRIENNDEGIRLDKYLALHSSLSRSRITALIDEKCLTVDGCPCTDPSRKVKKGEIYELKIPDAKEDSITAEDIKLDILYEDEYLIVLNKPAGMVVHPAAGNWSGTLVNALLHHAAASLSGIGGVKRPGIVHRLDKDTSGVLLVAKTDAAHINLTEQFAGHLIKKEYIAFVNGVINPLCGIIDNNIGRSPHNRQKQAVLGKGGKRAVSEYFTEKIYNDGEYSMVKVRIHTGRTHQIRVHMSHIGHSLLGDALYGKNNRRYIDRQALHAYRITFLHPVTGKQMTFIAELPADMKALMK